MFGLGWQELLLILIIALIFFGPSKLPEIGKSLGKTVSGFNKATKKIEDSLTKEIKDIKDSINDK